MSKHLQNLEKTSFSMFTRSQVVNIKIVMNIFETLKKQLRSHLP